MSIEWDKIESKPTKGYKVDGQDLLDLHKKILSYEKEIEELKKVRAELNHSLDSLEEKVSNLNSSIKDKDAKIQTLEASINEKDAKLSKITSEKDAEISKITSEKDAELSRIASEKDAKISKIASETESEISSLISQKDELISKLTSEKESAVDTIKIEMDEKLSKDSQEIQNLSNQIAQMQSEIESKTNNLANKEEEISQLNKTIEQLNSKIEELKEQIPKKPIYEEAEETVKGPACPKCGWTTLEDYKIIDGKKVLIRKHCPNTFCLWTSVEEPAITISLTSEEVEETAEVLKVFRIRGTELEEISKLDSSMVAIISDPAQNTVWIWKGSESSRFEYAEATRQATNVKNDVTKKQNARIMRVNQDEEPNDFPPIAKA